MSDKESPEQPERNLPASWQGNQSEGDTDAGPGGAPNVWPAGRGLAWWSSGWDMFRLAVGRWLAISVVLVVVNVFVGLVPMVGDLINSLLMPVFGGGLMLACRSLDVGEGVRVGHVFEGFKTNCNRLLTIGLLNLAAVTLIVVLAVFMGFSSGMLPSRGGAAPTGIFPAVVLLVLFGIPLLMAMWFAPALVVLHGVGALEAMKMSFKGCRRNLPPFAVYALVLVVLATVASLPMMLGWLILMPVMACSTYAAYHDIFTRSD